MEPPVTIPSTPLEPASPNPWTYYDIPNFYDRVRTSLNVGVSIITNDVIDYFEHAPFAQIKMRERVPIWRSLNEDKTNLFQTCIIYMTCYNLCPLVGSRGKVTEQTTPSLTLKYDVSSQKNAKPCDRFLALIDDLVSMILDEEPEYLFGFKVTKKYPECNCRSGKYIDNHNAFNPLWSD